MKTEFSTSAHANGVVPRAQANSDDHVKTAGNAAHELTSAMRDTADDAIESSKRGIEKAAQRAEAVATKSIESASNLAQKGVEIAKQSADKAKTLAQRCNEATSAYVTEQPIKSLLISTAVGAALATLVLSLTRRSRY
jgi:ElaB/YqjD/DUF883 family membrane-anchored ribosome-binding protein